MMRYAFVLSLLLALAQTTQAQSVGEKTVGEMRNLLRSEKDWILFAFGTVHAAGAIGQTCRNPRTAAELAAHLRYVAKPEASMGEALQAYWQAGGCELGWEPQDIALLEREYRRGYEEGRRSVISRLWTIRTAVEAAALEEAMRLAEAPGADADTLAAGLVAGARLWELRHGPMPARKDWR